MIGCESDWKWVWKVAGDVRKRMEWFGVNNRAWVWNRIRKVAWKETQSLQTG